MKEQGVQGSEREITKEEIEKFEHEYEEAAENLIENIELFADKNGFVGMDPASMGVGDLSFHDLPPELLAAAKETTFRVLGTGEQVESPGQIGIVNSYQTEASEEAMVPGEIDVLVFSTTRGVFLHMMTFEDKSIHWGISTKADKSV